MIVWSKGGLDNGKQTEKRSGWHNLELSLAHGFFEIGSIAELREVAKIGQTTAVRLVNLSGLHKSPVHKWIATYRYHIQHG